MWFEPSERNTLRPRENGVVLLKPVSLRLFFFLTCLNWRLPEPFIAQGWAVTTSSKTRQMAPGQVKPDALGHLWLGVENDVFNGVDTPGFVSCHAALG
jgi:hypothetical protein